MSPFSDPVLATLHQEMLTKHGQIRTITAAHPDDYFGHLAESIIGQQLATKVATTIKNRTLEAVGGAWSPDAVLRSSHETLRAAGLSNAKANYVRNLAEFWSTQSIQPDEYVNKSDEELIDHISQVKGIGRWTVEMFLIFSMGRPDVFSVGDYALRKATIMAYQLPETTTPKEILVISQNWQPQRSLASLVLWQSLD